MIEVLVELDFACCSCKCSVIVKLKCAGKGLAGGAHAVATVKLPCPTCGKINHLFFEPSGTVIAVRPWRPGVSAVPEPSVN